MHQTSRPRVLVLEDEAHVAMDIQENLERLGYEVVGPVASCEAALELIWSKDVDGAILDLILGETTCEVVANELTLNAIPWAFASGYVSHALHDRFPQAPIIAKPAAQEQLARIVGAMLDAPR